MDFLPKERIVVVGYGWVGQANALALSHAGYDTCYYDVGEPVLRYADRHREAYERIERLPSLLAKDGPHTWYLVCVGDRVADDGVQDIAAIKKALDALKGAKGGVILRSTVIPGLLKDLPFDYYVPEFLHEKKAVEECMRPQYFILGVRGEGKPEPSFFSTWRRAAVKTFLGTPEEASYLKYLSNVWNALRIAFVNEFGNSMNHPATPATLAKNERLINFFFEEKAYLRYGRSFGGHCLPKDTRAFYRWHKDQGKDVSLLEGVCRANDYHRGVIEAKHPHLPEWFSEWVRPQISRWVALDALRASVAKKFRRAFDVRRT